MPVSMNVAFTSLPVTNRSQERKDAEKQVVTGGGALAATGAAANAKATKSGVGLFATGTKNIKDAAKAAEQLTKETTSLMGKINKTAKWVKNSIIEWGGKFKDMKYIKPLINNRVFRFGAGVIGYGFGVITLISGLSDISKVATDSFDKITNK